VPGDFDDRSETFGSNFKQVTKRTPFCRLFIGAMEDFMLRILLVCACVSIIFGEAFATDTEGLDTSNFPLFSYFTLTAFRLD
jgi:magnesium-transporting ATPase (P-type)